MGEAWRGQGSWELQVQLSVDKYRAPELPKEHHSCLSFKAGDSTTNLHTALDMYKDHVQEMQGMQGMKLKYVKTTVYTKTCTRQRVFLSGYYEFLCRMYGLSGASGE